MKIELNSSFHTLCNISSDEAEQWLDTNSTGSNADVRANPALSSLEISGEGASAFKDKLLDKLKSCSQAKVWVDGKVELDNTSDQPTDMEHPKDHSHKQQINNSDECIKCGCNMLPERECEGMVEPACCSECGWVSKSKSEASTGSMTIEDLISLSKRTDLADQDLETLEKAFWDFYPHEITWPEVPRHAKEALVKIGRVLVQNARLKPSYLPESYKIGTIRRRRSGRYLKRASGWQKIGDSYQSKSDELSALLSTLEDNAVKSMYCPCCEVPQEECECPRGCEHCDCKSDDDESMTTYLQGGIGPNENN